MDLPDLPTHAVRTATHHEIEYAVRVLSRHYGAQVTITAHENPEAVVVELTATDGHTTRIVAGADAFSVLEALILLRDHEQLIVCGTPHVSRIGERTRARKPRKHACGRAFARRGGGTDDGVWRCGQCRDRRNQEQRERQRERRRNNRERR